MASQISQQYACQSEFLFFFFVVATRAGMDGCFEFFFLVVVGAGYEDSCCLSVYRPL